MSHERRKTKIGKVISDKMHKTLVVSVEWRSPHRIYKKNVRKWSRFKVHDENNVGNLGDTVLITESRPYSKTKRWKLSEILQSGDVADLHPRDIIVDGLDDSGKDASSAVAEPEPAEEDVIAEVSEVEGDVVAEVSEVEEDVVAEVSEVEEDVVAEVSEVEGDVVAEVSEVEGDVVAEVSEVEPEVK